MNADIIGLRARCENRRKLGIFDAESDGDGEELATLTVPLLMLERMLASAPAPASGGVDAVIEQASRLMAAGWRGNQNMSGDDRDFMSPSMRRRHDDKVRQVVEFVLASLSPAATPVSEAGPVAWSYEFEEARGRWIVKYSTTKPHHIEGFTRNISPLYPAKPASSPAGGDVEEIARLRASLAECAHFIISPLRLSNDEEEAARRADVYARAIAALSQSTSAGRGE